MQIVQTEKWILTMLLILPVKVFCDQPIQRNSMKNEDYDRRCSVNNILSDLRNNWQSPISYLQTRGYIPPNRGQTYNVQFRTKGQKIKGRDGGWLDNNKKLISGCDANVNKINVNFDASPLKTSNLNGNTNSNNFNAKLSSTPLKLNSELNTKLNLNSAVKTNHKMDSFSANAIARLKADTLSSSAANSRSSLKTSPNLINELNTGSHLNAYADMNNDLNQPPTIQNTVKGDPRNANFLHNVKNKFLGFFRGRPDAKVGNVKQNYEFENYDFSEPIAKEFTFGDDKLQEISNLYGKVTDPEIERIIQRGLRKDNDYDKEFLSNMANKDLLSKLEKYV